MKSLYPILQAMAAVTLLATPLQARSATVYHGFARLDPVEAAVIDNAYVVVDGERIVAVGSGAPPEQEGFEHVDMSGRYALPGFVDAHAHVTGGVRAVELEDGRPVIRETSSDDVTRFQALVTLAFGVTTIRNPAGNAEVNARYERMVQAGTWLGPEGLHAGNVMGPLALEYAVHPDGAAQWQDEVRRQRRLGADYVKLYAGLTEDELALGIEAAHGQGLETIGHLDLVSWTRAAELGIDALTHALPTSPDLLVGPARDEYLESRRGTPSAKFMYRWFELADYDSAPMQQMIRTLVEHDVLVDLTLLVNELVYSYNELSGAGELDGFTLQELERYGHPAHGQSWLEQLGASLGDWTADDYRRAKAVMPKVLELARRLHDAGVPMLLGTDGTGGGPLYARELELHVEAGIGVWDVLALATTRTAARLGLAEQTGALEPGLEADIVFLDANPLENVGDVRRVHTVVTDGRAYRPAELMERAAELAD